MLHLVKLRFYDNALALWWILSQSAECWSWKRACLLLLLLWLLVIHRFAYLTLDKVVLEDCGKVSRRNYLIISGFHANGYLRLGRWFIEHSDFSSVFSGLGSRQVRIHVILLFLQQGWVNRFLHQGQFSFDQISFWHIEKLFIHHVRLLVLIFAVILVHCRSISPCRRLLSVRPLTIIVLCDENSSCLTYCKVVRI